MTHAHFPGAADIPLEPKGSTVPPEQRLSGDPQASAMRLHEQGGAATGLWEVTPGEFVSIKADVVEVMHFVSGAGSIEHPDGSITTIAPGAVVSVGPDWRGIWRVTETARKFYAVFPAPQTT